MRACTPNPGPPRGFGARRRFLRTLGRANFAGMSVTRPILEPARIHPAIDQRIRELHRDLIDEVEMAIAGNDVVIVGMGANPFPRKARKLLDAIGQPYRYLEYGNYLNQWRRRNALKMWTGWPTFPMVFVRGVLIGGASELAVLQASGELARLLAAPVSVPVDDGPHAPGPDMPDAPEAPDAPGARSERAPTGA